MTLTLSASQNCWTARMMLIAINGNLCLKSRVLCTGDLPHRQQQVWKGPGRRISIAKRLFKHLSCRRIRILPSVEDVFCKVNFVVLRSRCAFTRRALCALCSVGSAGSLAMFFLCMSSSTSSVLLRSLEAEGQSVDSHFTCEGSFEPDSIRLKF